MASEAIWSYLGDHLAQLALLTLAWSAAQGWLHGRPRRVRKILSGCITGAAAIAAMSEAIEIQPGVFFDLRATVIAIGVFLGGPVVAVVSGVIAGAYRIWLGGAGALAGVTSLVGAAGVGLAVRAALGSPAPRPEAVFGLAYATASLCFVVPLTLPHAVAMRVIPEVAPTFAAMTFLGTLLMGFTLLHARSSAHERYILRAALAQAPEFQYVKDRNCAFIATNMNLARHNGFARPEEMIGKTDIDLSPGPQGALLVSQEAAVVRTGKTLVDFEEELVGPDGRLRWYRTSKAPIRDGDGRVVALAGVTVDVSTQKRLELDAMENRNLLALALSEMSDGLALFDGARRMSFCNAQYLAAFPRSADHRRAGVHIHDMLAAAARSGEQPGLPACGGPAIERAADEMWRDGEEEIELADGRILSQRRRAVADGGLLIVVGDVTELKRAERALRRANAELAVQASTDALTGLANRRSFDAALTAEIERSSRADRNLSLLMIDADRFKDFNDRYGHQAGDACLRAIAGCLRSALRRPADLAARYGGEEFAVILPNTDRRGAEHVAESIRRRLRDCAIPHAANEPGHVTVSIGLAHFDRDVTVRSAETLVARADEALYLAKSAGRDRVVGWRLRLSA